MKRWARTQGGADAGQAGKQTGRQAEPVTPAHPWRRIPLGPTWPPLPGCHAPGSARSGTAPQPVGRAWPAGARAGWQHHHRLPQTSCYGTHMWRCNGQPRTQRTCSSAGSGRPDCASRACLGSTPTLSAISLQTAASVHVSTSACLSFTATDARRPSCGPQPRPRPPPAPPPLTHWSRASRLLSARPHSAHDSMEKGWASRQWYSRTSGRSSMKPAVPSEGAGAGEVGPGDMQGRDTGSPSPGSQKPCKCHPRAPTHRPRLGHSCRRAAWRRPGAALSRRRRGPCSSAPIAPAAPPPTAPAPCHA